MISISFINFNLDIGSETDMKREHKCLTFADIHNQTSSQHSQSKSGSFLSAS